ncbi:MAG: prepilin peptidase [Sandaracinus sp.]|nr:prepilin peptidase [Sandaracinus sp.]
MLSLSIPKALFFGELAALGIALVSAVTDWRRGEIPNWLTLPPLVVGPLFWLLVGGFNEAGLMLMLKSIISIAVCGLVPYLLWRRNALGGGDVKIVAAMGGLVHMSYGLEIVLAGLIASSIYALLRLAWEGLLLRTLANSFFLALNPILPKDWRREISREQMSYVRMGGGFAVGALVVTLSHHPELWS